MVQFLPRLRGTLPQGAVVLLLAHVERRHRSTLQRLTMIPLQRRRTTPTSWPVLHRRRSLTPGASPTALWRTCMVTACLVTGDVVRVRGADRASDEATLRQADAGTILHAGQPSSPVSSARSQRFQALSRRLACRLLLYYGCTSGTPQALSADLVPDAMRGTAYRNSSTVKEQKGRE